MQTKGRKRNGATARLLTSAALLLAGAAAQADEVIIAHLAPTTTSAARGLVELKLTLSTEKPAGITREPAYKHTPKYGVLRIGDAADNRIFVALDAPDDPKLLPALYVDSNGNGDLTDDPPVTLAFPPRIKPAPKPAKTDGKPTPKKEDKKEEPKPEEVKPALEGRASVIERYKSAGRVSSIPGFVKFIFRSGELSYVSDIVRTGEVKVGPRTYRIALVDETATGLFNSYDHDDDQPVKVHLLIDRNGDGKFDPKRETFDALLPFRLASGSYQVKSIDPRGTFLTLGLAAREVAGTIKPADMKIGSDIIDFDAKAIDGRIVSFPDDYKGKIVLLAFSVAADKQSVAEIPDLVNLYTQFHEKGLEILSVDPTTFENEAEAATLLAQIYQKLNAPWRVVNDSDQGIYRQFGIRKVPTYFLVDGRTNKIIAMDNELHGPISQVTVMKAIDDLNKQPQGGN